MTEKNMIRSFLVGSISGFILTFYLYYIVSYTLSTYAPIPSDFTRWGGLNLLLTYYIFNCLLLLSSFFLLKNNKVLIAKSVAIILILSILASLFWGGFGENSVFFFSTFGPIILGVTVVPLFLFWWGVGSSLILIFKNFTTNTNVS